MDKINGHWTGVTITPAMYRCADTYKREFLYSEDIEYIRNLAKLSFADPDNAAMADAI